MLRAIEAAKKQNDRIDTNKICDCLQPRLWAATSVNEGENLRDCMY